jgi:hypothetical protein
MFPGKISNLHSVTEPFREAKKLGPTPDGVSLGVLHASIWFTQLDH